ncbi:hypothetical protein DVH24_017964 [Malus domestica]|uniref:Uncharacterized protein n=1 Tax=Malus domestica TaxID=3750 RepID=A0A498KJX7_MALDO|nr:hypothetical protein DVH24_017964 [Malus domestica]
MPPSSDPAVPTVTPVTISYSELQKEFINESVKKINHMNLHIIFVIVSLSFQLLVPGYSSLRGNLLHLSPRYNFGWSHGKEKLESGKPDTLKGSFYANPILDSPTTDESLIQRYPSYCGSNIWPNKRIKNALSPNVEELSV